MKIILLLIYFFALSSFCYSQKIDYKDIRHAKYLSTCGTDSLEILKAHHALLQVKVKKINKNLDIYYHDLGYIYYKMSLITHNKKYLDSANTVFKKGLKINPVNIDILWDGAIALVFSKHCNDGMKYLNAYLKIVPISEVDTEAVNSLKILCKIK